MSEHSFKIEFGNSWRKYAKNLIETVPEVIKEFNGTPIESNMNNFYEEAVPRKRESPINFLIRNLNLSYKPCSKHQEAEFFANNFILKLGWHTRNIPLLKRIIRLDRVSTELFIGQESSSYISDRGVEESQKFGDDRIYFRISNAAEPMDIDFDVGFESGRNYFFKINVHDNSLLSSAEKTYEILKNSKEKKK